MHRLPAPLPQTGYDAPACKTNVQDDDQTTAPEQAAAGLRALSRPLWRELIDNGEGNTSPILARLSDCDGAFGLLDRGIAIRKQESLNILHRSEGHHRHAVDAAASGMEEGRALGEGADVMKLDITFDQTAGVGLGDDYLGMIVQPKPLERLAVKLVAPDMRLDQNNGVVAGRVRKDDELAGKHRRKIAENGLVFGENLAAHALGAEDRSRSSRLAKLR